MSFPISTATAAYGQAQKLIGQASKAAPEIVPQANDGQGFSEMLSQSLNSVVETGQAADQKSMQMVNGTANIVDVVTAIAETEVAIESMVAIRDRVIQAYESIMRMPI